MLMGIYERALGVGDWTPLRRMCPRMISTSHYLEIQTKLPAQDDVFLVETVE